MNTSLFRRFVLSLVFAASVAAPLRAAEPAEKPAEEEKSDPLNLPPEKRSAAGLVLAKPAAATLAPEVRAFGRVLDPAPGIALAAELETARAAMAASEKELARAQKLFSADGNGSAQAVESAQSAAARDRAAFNSARGRFIATFGRALVDSANLDQMVAALEQGVALARVDVLPGDEPAPNPKTVRIGAVGREEMFDAPVLGAAPTVDPQVGGQGFFVLLRDHPLAAGTALRAVLPGVGEPQSVLTVPRTAVVYHEGSAWVYVSGDKNTFARKRLTLGRTVGDAIAVTDGLDASDDVVTTGAQQLLSTELQAAGGGEDED
jgi:hypothetical protein